MSNKERKKEISKQPIPTIEECLGFYKELTNLADVRFVPYYKMAIEALEKEPCEDCISRQAAIDCLNADFTIDGKENMETVVDYINGAFKQIKALPSVTPKPFINKPCVSEGVCREDKIQVLDKIRAEIKGLSPEPTIYDIVDRNQKKDAVWETVNDVLQIIDEYRERDE